MRWVFRPKGRMSVRASLIMFLYERLKPNITILSKHPLINFLSLYFNYLLNLPSYLISSKYRLYYLLSLTCKGFSFFSASVPTCCLFLSPGAKVQVVSLLWQEEQASQRQQQRPRGRARHGWRQVPRHQLPLILWPTPTERGECVLLCACFRVIIPHTGFRCGRYLDRYISTSPLAAASA